MPRSRARRVVRVAGYALAGLVLVVVASAAALLLYARSEGGRERVRRLVLDRARASVPGLEIGHVGGDYLHDLVLTDVTVRDRAGRPAVHVDRISARFSLWPLLRKRLYVRELLIEAPDLLVRANPDGTLNTSELVTPPREPAPKPSPEAGAGVQLQVDRLRVSDGRADVETAAGQSIQVGALDLEGSLATRGRGVEATIASLQVRAEVDGAPYALDARLAALVGPEALHARLERLAVRGLARQGEIVVTGEAGGAREDVGLRLDVALPAAGTLALRGRVGLAPAGLGDYALELRGAGLDPSAVRATAPAGSLAFMLRARGTGAPPSPGSRAHVTLDVPRSRVAGYQLLGAHFGARTDGDRWRIERAFVRGAGAELTLAGAGRAATLDARLRATVGDPADGPLPTRDVRGRGALDVRLRGTFPDDVALSARGDFRQLAAQTTTIRNLALALDARGAVRSPRGRLHLRADGVRAGAQALDRAVLAIASDGRHVRLRADVAGPGVRGGLAASGAVTPRQADVTLERFSLALHGPRLEQTVALLEPVAIRWRADDLIELGQLRLRASGGRLSGELAASGSYRLDRRQREPRARGAVSLRRFAVAGFDPIDADGWLELGRTRAAAKLDASSVNARLHLDAQVPLAPRPGGAPALARRGALAVNLQTNAIKLQELPLLQKRLARRGLTGGTLNLTARLVGDVAHPDAKLAFDLREVELRSVSGRGRDSTVRRLPGLGASLELGTRRGALDVAGQALIHGAGVADFTGRFAVDAGELLAGADLGRAPMKLALAIPKFELASLARLDARLRDTSGTLFGEAELTGTLQRPVGRADLRIADARVDQLRFGPIAAHAETDGRTMRAKLTMRQQQGGSLTAQADLARGGDGLAASLVAQKLDVAFLRPFTTGVREIAGVVDADVRAEGTLAEPRLRGALYYYGGRLGVVGQPTFHDLGVAVALAPGRIELQKLEAFSGGGSLRGKGSFTLDGTTPTGMVLTAHADRFVLAAAGSTGARLDGDIAIAAETRAAILSGKVEVPRASLWLPKVGSSGRKLQKIGQHADVRFVDEAARAADEKQQAGAGAKPAKQVDLQAVAGTVYVRGKDLDVELDSKLRVTTGRDGTPAINGVVQIRRGHINVTGQRFELDAGQISFAGPPDPQLAIRLTHQYPDALVAVEIHGTPSKPELRLVSEPPIYDQAQIVSLVLTGQPGGQPSTGGSIDPKSAIATTVLGKLADKLAPELGLDVLRVEALEDKGAAGTAGEKETRVEVGKYVTERIYLSYAHVFGATQNQNANEAQAEYRVSRRWLVQTVFGDAGAGGVDALWTYRY